MGTTIARRIRQLSSAMEPRVSRVSRAGGPACFDVLFGLRRLGQAGEGMIERAEPFFSHV